MFQDALLSRRHNAAAGARRQLSACVLPVGIPCFLPFAMKVTTVVLLILCYFVFVIAQQTARSNSKCSFAPAPRRRRRGASRGRAATATPNCFRTIPTWPSCLWGRRLAWLRVFCHTVSYNSCHAVLFALRSDACVATWPLSCRSPRK